MDFGGEGEGGADVRQSEGAKEQGSRSEALGRYVILNLSQAGAGMRMRQAKSDLT